MTKTVLNPERYIDSAYSRWDVYPTLHKLYISKDGLYSLEDAIKRVAIPCTISYNIKEPTYFEIRANKIDKLNLDLYASVEFPSPVFDYYLIISDEKLSNSMEGRFRDNKLLEHLLNSKILGKLGDYVIKDIGEGMKPGLEGVLILNGEKSYSASAGIISPNDINIIPSKSARYKDIKNVDQIVLDPRLIPNI